MPRISFQFVALPTEVAAVVRKVAAEQEAHVVGIEHYPFAATLILNPDGVDLTKYEELFLNVRPFQHLAARGGIALLDANPCCLQVHMPRMAEGILNEAFIAAECTAMEGLKPWKTAIAYMRRRTAKGGWVVNPTTGVRAFYRSLAATPAAIKECQEKNIRMMNFRGGNVLEFESYAAKAKEA